MNVVPGQIAERKPEDAEAAIRPGPLRFAIMIILVLLAVAATTLAIVFLVPDGSDYARASGLKHQRLASLPSPKIVLIGGSNLAYGIDSAILEQETKCPVVNMGMNGYLGARLMLAEATPFLKKSDIVVISLEYQNFFNSIDGNNTDQLMLAKANPEVWSYLSPQQQWRAIVGLPLVAQQKLFRLIRSAMSFNDGSNFDMSEQIETFAGFNKYGDLTSHLALEWPYDDTDRFELSKRTPDPDIVPLLQSFTAKMSERGVKTIYSYSPLKRDFYQAHEKAIDALHARMTAGGAVTVPQPPTTFVYDSPLFFDSIYHLNVKGRPLRSKQLAADIRNAVFRGGDCATGPRG